MYKPSLKSTWTLAVLALVAYLLFAWVEYAKVPVKQPASEQKLAAVELMYEALAAIRDHRLPLAVVVDDLNDPIQAALIGQQNTLITTTAGQFAAKLTTINPNFAAVMVDMYLAAGVRSGDQVALAITGSFPAMNIAALAACKVLELEPVIITSVSSSGWGANNPDFTWLDMETLLREERILPYKSIAASIGGGDDIGRSLAPQGRELILEAIERNQVPLLGDSSLFANIDQRYLLYMSQLGPTGYHLYVNIGGGVASLGHVDNSDLIGVGVSRNLGLVNFPRKGVLHRFARKAIPVINVQQIETLAYQYGLSIAPPVLPERGVGRLFVKEQYNLKLAWLALALISTMVFFVIKYDIKAHKLADEGVNPDEL